MEFNFQGIIADSNVDDTVFCEEPPYLVQFNGSGESVPYHFWNFGDGGTSIETNPVHEYAAAGLYDIRYIVIDSNTCNISDTSYSTLEIIQKETFSMIWESTPPSLCEDTLFVSMAFTGSGADSLIWNMDDGTIYYNDTVITHTYYIPGVYNATLTAYDLDCNISEIGEQTYVLTDEIITGLLDVPNIFSPNGDGLNDVFRLFFKDKPLANPLVAMQYYNVIIYNRWGKEIFESGDNISDWVWDGTIDGRNADEGVYYYIILYNSLCEDEGTIRKTGYVTLVR
jgi:gliding motility-associated-like protein